MFRILQSSQKLTFLMLIFMLAGCAQGGAGSAPAQPSLVDTKWKLVEMGAPGAEAPDLAQAEITLAFDDQGRVSGKSGCNQYGGGYELNGDTLKFSEVFSTMMACDPALMQLEQDYLAALNNADRFELGQDSLTITYSGGPARLVFARQ